MIIQPDLSSMFSRRDWARVWLRAAAVGTLLLAVYFVGYELLEQLWMKERLPVDRLFTLHRYRGLLASALIGTTSIYVIWRSRRTHDQAFLQAYREVEEVMRTRTLALDQNRAFTERLFDALRDRLIVVDRDGVIVKANRVAIESICGTSPVGHTCSMLGGACSPSEEAVSPFAPSGPGCQSSASASARTRARGGSTPSTPTRCPISTARGRW